MEEEQRMRRKRRRNLIFLNVFKSKRFFTFFESDHFPMHLFQHTLTHTLELNEARMLRNKSQMVFFANDVRLFLLFSMHIYAHNIFILNFFPLFHFGFVYKQSGIEIDLFLHGTESRLLLIHSHTCISHRAYFMKCVQHLQYECVCIHCVYMNQNGWKLFRVH